MMTAQEYRDEIARLGLSQGEAAAFLGVNERTSRRWAAGTSKIPHAVALVLTHLASPGGWLNAVPYSSLKRSSGGPV